MIQTATAIDRYTVELDMGQFWSAWQYNIGTSKRMFYAPEAKEAGLTDWRNACGTGAFQVVDYIEGSAAYFDKNPVYWQDNYIMPDGKGYQLPFADHFVLAIIPDEASQIAALRTGKLDAMRKVKWQYVETLAKTNPELNKWEWDNWGGMNIGVRLDTEPFTDRNVRLALSAAIDRDAISSELMGGYTVFLNFPYPAVWPETLYTPVSGLAEDTQRSYTYDPEWSMELLAEAGYPNGFTTSCLVTNIPWQVDVMSMVIDNWADIGVTLTIDPVDHTTLRGYISALHHPQMLAYEDSSAIPASAMTGYIEEGFTNYIIMRDPYVEATYDAAMAATDSAEQARLWKELGIYCLNDGAYINLPAENGFTYAWPWIKNYMGEVNPKYLCGAYAFVYAWVDQALKAEMGY